MLTAKLMVAYASSWFLPLFFGVGYLQQMVTGSIGVAYDYRSPLLAIPGFQQLIEATLATKNWAGTG